MKTIALGVVAIIGSLLAADLSPQSRPAAATQTASVAGSQPARLTIATYNINYGLRAREDLAQAADAIRKADADVVAIQEGNAELYAHLKTALAGKYPHMAFYPGSAAGGFAWLSKLPLKNPRVLAHRYGWFDTRLADVTVGGKIIQLADIHLCPTIPPEQAGMIEMLKLAAQTEGIRQKEIVEICKLIKPGPAILLGDFNSPPNLTIWAFMNQCGYVDSLWAVSKAIAHEYTFENTHTGQAWRFRMDYVFHTTDLNTRRAEVLHVGASDHYLQVSTIELSPSTTKPARIAASAPASAPAGAARP